MKMQAMRIALEELVSRMREVKEEPSEKDGIWFQHKSPFKLDELVPLSYKELHAVRPGYNMTWRRDTEEHYHRMMNGPFKSEDNSFLYATIVGYNKMENPESYPGFTYYFRLTDEEVNNCLFEIVDKTYRMKVQLGMEGLLAAMKEWKANQHKYSSYYEKDLGEVDPRIEVIIPFKVVPELYFPQEEDR